MVLFNTEIFICLIPKSIVFISLFDVKNTTFGTAIAKFKNVVADCEKKL